MCSVEAHTFICPKNIFFFPLFFHIVGRGHYVGVRRHPEKKGYYEMIDSLVPKKRAVMQFKSLMDFIDTRLSSSMSQPFSTLPQHALVHTCEYGVLLVMDAGTVFPKRIVLESPHVMPSHAHVVDLS